MRRLWKSRMTIEVLRCISGWRELDMKHHYLTLCFTLHPYLETVYVLDHDGHTSNPAQSLSTVHTYA
jgi:hypothetical protein